MREIKELYVILYLEFSKTSPSVYFGICEMIERLYSNQLITNAEFKLLSSHFKAQKPSRYNKYRKFYKSPLFNRYGAYWWIRDVERMDEIFKERQKFIIEVLIKTDTWRERIRIALIKFKL